MSHCTTVTTVVGRASRFARGVFIAAALLSAQAARAETPGARAPIPPAQPEPRTVPLSAEDASLVRELELVENAELLRHLELFEKPEPPARHPSPPATPTSTPARK